MASDLDWQAVELWARNPDASLDSWSVMRFLMTRTSQDREQEERAKIVALHLLANPEAVAGLGPLLGTLVRSVGLYPYLEQDDLRSTADQIAYEFHRAPALGEYVLHRDQATVLRELNSGANVVLSAPTSFGKSLLIDALIAEGRYDNVLICVPTIALIDETRRRLFERFGAQYRILTHASQRQGARNIYILTQERALELQTLDQFDLFVLDEFYKLARSDGDTSRSVMLNELFYRVLKTDTQFYLLGPSIDAISAGFESTFSCKFIRSNYATVACDVISLVESRARPSTEDKLGRIGHLCDKLNDPTLIFCSSPDKAHRIAKKLIEEDVSASVDLSPAIEWIGANFHPKWVVAEALQAGIGVHHAAMPRALAQYIVRLFNDRQLRFLICTSTLIEGVNTAAKNVIVFDNTINRRKYDYFTFSNIKGRSGRMFQHFVGHVYLLEHAPKVMLPTVEFPFFDQPSDTPTGLLVQLDAEDLSEHSDERISEIMSQDVLSLETIRANKGAEPEAQIAVAEEISSRFRHYSRLLAWREMPNGEQLDATAELIWEHLAARRGGGIRSWKQLSYKVRQLMAGRTIGDLIQSDTDNLNQKFRLEPSEACARNLRFLRTWVQFAFPRYLRVLDAIQEEIFERKGRRPGNYAVFAARLEACFYAPYVMALEEYGVPMQLGDRLSKVIGHRLDLDKALKALKELRPEDMKLHAFERELLAETRKFL